MFQPQPTPFASTCFASYGVGNYNFAPSPLSLQTVQARQASGGGQSLLYASSHASSSSTSPADSSHGHYSPLSSSSAHNLSTFAKRVKMEPDMDPSLQDDLSAQEAAAREYQPELKGPLVGNKMPSDAITEEYAKADPIYVEKTIALPQTYSHYRPIQGDGNCGWRAIGFAYFESLINNAGLDPEQMDKEVARLTSMDQILTSVGGFDKFLFEDMVQETICLLKDLAAAATDPDVAMAILMEKFNDRDVSNAIVYHLRLLASSWLKGEPALYEPFIPGDLGVAGYCSEYIERVDREIEHVGITVLVNVLLKPLNMTLEIAYLDRSPGNQVNTYRFPGSATDDAPQAPGMTIYLLYRPDHYDILYRGPVQIQVLRAASFTHDHNITNSPATLSAFSNFDYRSLAMIPGLGGAPPSLSSLGVTGPPTLNGSFMSILQHPQASWVPQSGFSDAIRQPIQARAAEHPLPPDMTTSYPLRFSQECYKLSGDNSAFPEPSFTTATFRNSHFNKAHYNNPDFHPEEWRPEEEASEKTLAVRKGRNKTE